MRLLLLAVLTSLALAWLVLEEAPPPAAPVVTEPASGASATSPAELASPTAVLEPRIAAAREAPAEAPQDQASPTAPPATTGSIRGRFLLPRGFEAMPVALRAEWPSPETGWRDATKVLLSVDEDGSFELGEVPPGEVRVVARRQMLFTDQVLVQAEGQVAAGARVDLGLLDLRGKLWQVEIQVVDSAGQPVPDSVGTHNYPDNEDIEIVAGRARVTVGKTGDVAWFGAPGYRATRVDDLLDGTVVVLEEAPLLQLQVTNPEALPDAPWELVTQLQPNEGYDNWVYMLTVTSPEARITQWETPIRIPRPADNLILRWRLVEAGVEGRQPVKVDAPQVAKPTILAVGDEGAVRSVTLDPEAIARAVAQAEAKREAAQRKREERARAKEQGQ